MLQTHELRFAYDAQNAFTFPDVSLSNGQDLLVLGPSGKGKTTLMHLIAGLLKPSSGSISIAGQVLNAMSESRIDRFRGKNIGIVFQKHYFLQSITLYENLILKQQLIHQSNNDKTIVLLLDRLGIADKAAAKANMLSQGEQQRAAIAMALVNQPQLVLADEPTSSLDDDNAMEVAMLLKEQASLLNASLLIITHDHRLREVFKHHVQL